MYGKLYSKTSVLKKINAKRLTHHATTKIADTTISMPMTTEWIQAIQSWAILTCTEWELQPDYDPGHLIIKYMQQLAINVQEYHLHWYADGVIIGMSLDSFKDAWLIRLNVASMSECLWWRCCSVIRLPDAATFDQRIVRRCNLLQYMLYMYARRLATISLIVTVQDLFLPNSWRLFNNTPKDSHIFGVKFYMRAYYIKNWHKIGLDSCVEVADIVNTHAPFENYLRFFDCHLWRNVNFNR